MKRNNKKRILRAVCLALVLVLTAMIFVSCSGNVKDPVLEYGKHKISLSMYEFMLARMKGTLARNKYDVTPLSDFWNEKHTGGELTNEEYYNKTILDTCKNYLAALVVFDEEGLSLPQETLENIEEEIKFYIEYDCQGSEEKLDAILAKYGTDTDGLRKIYEMEMKYQAVIAHLYGANGSQISDSLKEQYYQENYYRFKQIIVSNYYYEYETDEYGCMIYFDPESGKPLYDKENGEYIFDENGSRIEDEYGVDIRFDKDGKPLYDKEKGAPAPTTDENGNAIKHPYSEEEMAKRAEAVENILNAASGGNTSAFEALMPEWQVYIGAGEYYSDGYYLSDIESGAYNDNILEIFETLKGIEIGETAVVENKDSGYHIIMRYELDKGKYKNSDYAEWFTSFNDSLITKLFIDKCESFYDKIKINDDNLKNAKSIKSLGANYDY